MFTVISSLPILLIIYLMIFQHWNGLKAGLAGWAAGCTIGFVWFGLTPQVLWVSQLKGLYLSFFVLAILWPALFLFQTVKEIGGIQGIVDFLNETLVDQDLLVVGLSWAFSGMLEGLAGFGLPIAIVAPMLVGLGVKPLYAVAAVAVGHSWSVTFGDMGVIYQTLLNLTGLSSKELVLPASILLGSACLACGLGAVFILNRKKVWFKVVLISIAMGFIQYLLAAAGILPLSAFGAGFSGMYSCFSGRQDETNNIDRGQRQSSPY